MIFNVAGFVIDIAFVLASGIISTFTPKKMRPKLKDKVNNILAIEDTPKPDNKCYAVQVFNFPIEKKSSNSANASGKNPGLSHK